MTMLFHALTSLSLRLTLEREYVEVFQVYRVVA